MEVAHSLHRLPESGVIMLALALKNAATQVTESAKLSAQWKRIKHQYHLLLEVNDCYYIIYKRLSILFGENAIMRYAEQLRAGRALLDWSQDTLAERSDVGVATIRRLEGQSGILRGSIRTVWALQAALEQGGVIFLSEEDGLGPGVRLALPPSAV